MCGVARKRVEFRLDVHGSRYPDGADYLLWRDVPEARVAELGIPRSWHHSWDDGWGATVTARLMAKGERRKKSAGFRGYDWMVRNILRWGTTRCRCEWVPDPDPPRDEGAWERCVHCRTSRMTEESRVARVLMKGDGDA